MSLIRRRAVLGAAAALSLLVAACGGDGDDESVAEEASDEETQDEGAAGEDGDGGAADLSGQTVEWWHIQPEDGDLGQEWRAFADEFSGETGAQIDVTPMENDAFKTSIATAVQAGEPPDLFQSWGGGGLRTQAQAGQVMDLTDELPGVIERISPGALEAYTIDGRVYGIPFNTGMVGFWYNTELFEQAGIDAPPETWSEFLDVVQQLKDADITPIALGGADLWPGHFWWAYLGMRIAGLDTFVEAGENQEFSDPGLVEAGERLQELVEMDPFQEGFLAVGYEEGDGQAATMGNGDAAMELMGHWAPGGQIDWAGLEGEEADALVERLGFFQFPVVEGGEGALTEILAGGDGFAVGADAPEATLEFIRYIFDDFDRVMNTPGNVPVLADAADQVDDPNLAQVLEAVNNSTGVQLYLDQDYPEAVGNAINESTGALIAGEMSPEEVVESINEVWARE